LKINDKIYKFIDIEFYFFNKHHKDGYVLEHKRKIGEFEAHKYGVDISLGNSKESYGGILIKALKDEDNNIIIKSKIKNTIINNLIISKNIISLVKKIKTTQYELIRTSRDKLGKIEVSKNKTNHYKSAKYRYVIYDSELFKSYKGKENILHNSDLDRSDIIDLLGYELKNNNMIQ